MGSCQITKFSIVEISSEKVEFSIFVTFKASGQNKYLIFISWVKNLKDF